ncbi:MAG TPA: serine/threonine-protein kinase [Planctomycetota bacterium]
MAAELDIRTRAEKAFRDYLDLVRSGSGPEPEAFASSHPPEIAAELRRILEDYRFLQENLGGSVLEGRILGDFQLLREIGRGGMGVVWEAEQRSLGRKIALKVLHPHLGISSVWIERFQREAQAGGRLNHPGIVAIHGVGESEGTHYIVEELVPGSRTLADRISEARDALELPAGYFRVTAETFARIADAVHAAHGAGIVHRDLKPANILLAEDGPKVADFGVARIQEDFSLSRSGEMLGTPYYMSPEQLASRRLPLDHRSDVFSLGATLYEALTLVRPFEGDTSQQIAQKVVLEDPPDPCSVRSRVPRELAMICMKALEKSPARRFPDMEAFAGDLRRWLAGEAILARPSSRAARAVKWMRRHPAAAAAAAVAVGAFAAITLLFLDARAARQRADLAAERALEESGTSQRVVDFMVDLFSSTDPAEARGIERTDSEMLEIGRGKLVEGLEEEPVIRATLLLTLGRVYRNRGGLAEAEPLLVEALEIRRRELGPLDQRTFAAMNNLAHLRVALAQYDAAEALYREAQQGYELAFGERHPLALENAGNLGWLYFNTGRAAEAEPLLEATLEGSLELYEEDHTRVLAAYSNLEDVRLKLGRLDEVAAGAEELLARFRKAFEPDHPALLGRLHATAHLYRRMERWEEAERYYLESLAGNRRVHGDSHVATLTNRNGLGMLYYETGRYAEAEPYFRATLAGRRDSLGAAHPSTRTVMNNLVRLLLATGEFAEAETLAQELVAVTPLDDASRSAREALLLRVRKAREQR